MARNNPTPTTWPGVSTARLRLAPLGPSDGDDLYRLYGDPAVMAIRKIGTQSRTGSDAQLAEIVAHWRAHGFGLWAVRDLATGAFLGECGLRYHAPASPIVELSYGLVPAAQGRGYATEASRAVLTAGFGRLGLERVHAFAQASNAASRRVMEKLGFTHELSFGEGQVSVVRYVLERQDWAVG